MPSPPAPAPPRAVRRSRDGGRLTLHETDLPAFAAAFDAEVRRWLPPRTSRGSSTLTARSTRAISASVSRGHQGRRALGQGFPEPLFDNAFDVLDRRVVGGALRLTLRPLGASGAWRRSPSSGEQAAAGMPARLRVA